MATSVIRHLMNFLKVKGMYYFKVLKTTKPFHTLSATKYLPIKYVPGIVTLDPKQQRDFLKQLWFSLYSRGKGKIGSSGFEHIFVSELKNQEVSGMCFTYLYIFLQNI